MVILGLCIFEQIQNHIIKAVVVKVNENELLVMGIENGEGLYSVGLNDFKNMKFEKGQEILIYFNGVLLESYPEQFGNIEKIKIIKDKTNIQIPDNTIRFCYNTKDKVNITISELTNSDITLYITDTNDLQYNYSHNYRINKKVKNENYTGIGQKLGEDAENSTSGFTGTGEEYIWKEVSRISNISSENTEESLFNTTEDDLTIVRKFNWTNLYGNLGTGEYEFILSDYDSLTLSVKFTINTDGTIIYNEPTIF